MLVHLFLLCCFGSSHFVNGISCFGDWSLHETDLCNVTTTDGFEMAEYNCSQVCCGGRLHPRTVGNECCGSEERGQMYNYETKICCSWWFTGQYAVYEKQNKGEHCCGVTLFDPETYSNGTNCCRGWKTLPTPFNSRTEMCCQGYVTFVGDTSYGHCCGIEGYDRRTSSCPCYRHPVAKGYTRDEVSCCRSRDYRVINPYAPASQGCCNGVAYNHENEFCCNGVVGDGSTHVCCDGELFSRNPEKDGSVLGCCIGPDGSSVQYNVENEACCNGEINQLPFGTRGLCCGNSLSIVSSRGSFGCCLSHENAVVFDQSDSVCCEGTVGVGDSCCANISYFDEENICCEGIVGPGDSCCGQQHYFSGKRVCCDYHLGHDTYTQPACCGNRSFDSFTHTCCGSRVIDNPLVPTGYEDIFYVSHATRCCGDHSEPSSLFPYDYNTSICCDGAINDVGFLTIDDFQCCGEEAMDKKTHICCNGSIVPRNLLAEDNADELSLCDGDGEIL